jgi:CRP/FNR family nitrogen fixation transcriptional regulator
MCGGTVRTYKVLNDGRRQIGAFYLAGDVFGLEVGEEHTFSAEAITDCKILVIKRSALIGLQRNQSGTLHNKNLTMADSFSRDCVCILNF